MDSARDPMRGAQPFLGSAARDRPVKVSGPVGPWHARISITPIVLRRGARFEVTCEWFGPDTEGGYPGGEQVQAMDSHWCDTIEQARELADLAEAKLSDGRAPKLSELSRSCNRRA